MKKLTNSQKDSLIELVMAWIKKDVEDGDIQCIETLIRSCPTNNLTTYLPKKEFKKWKENIV
jgi:hypothetical protein